MAYTLTVGDIISRNATAKTDYDVTAKMRGWTDQYLDFGGYWNGNGTLWLGKHDTKVGREEAVEFFTTRLGAHIVRSQSKQVKWEGRITAMSLVLDGIPYRRDLAKMVNRGKLVYSRYTGNSLLDGSAELSTIVADAGAANKMHGTYNGDTTFENARHAPYHDRNGSANKPFPIVTLSSAWASHGAKSLYVDCSSCTWYDARIDEWIIWGGGVGFFSGLTAVADSWYYLTFDVKIAEIGATCTISVSVNDGTDEQFSGPVAPTGTTGVFHYRKRFKTRKTVSGSLSALVISDDDSAKYYIDAGSTRELGIRRETDWQSNAASIALYGTHEQEIVVAGMTDEQATAHLTQLINGLAWPRTFKDSTETLTDDEDGLVIEAEGYVTTMSSQQVTLGGVKTCKQHITDLVGLSEFITAGYLEANDMTIYIDEENPNRLWDSIQLVCDTGGYSGVQYLGGVGPGRKLDYRLKPTTMAYRRKGKRWLNPDGTEADPQSMTPGIVLLEDLPSSGAVFARIEDDPRYLYVSGWQYDADTDTATPLETRELLEIE
jgi:hypothetical protein